MGAARRRAGGGEPPQSLTGARPDARWRRFRILNLADAEARACLAAIPHMSIPGRRDAKEPGMIVSDNGAA